MSQSTTSASVPSLLASQSFRTVYRWAIPPCGKLEKTSQRGRDRALWRQHPSGDASRKRSSGRHAPCLAPSILLPTYIFPSPSATKGHLLHSKDDSLHLHLQLVCVKAEEVRSYDKQPFCKVNVLLYDPVPDGRTRSTPGFLILCTTSHLAQAAPVICELCSCFRPS